MYPDITKDTDCLVELYYLKKFALMLENIDGNFNRVEEIFSSKKNMSEVTSSDELYKIICEIQEEIAGLIPDEQMTKWMESDYTVFTEKNHPRCFWNEIPNDKATKELLEKFAELLSVDDINGAYSINLYNFNGFDVYFETIEDAESFANNFDCTPYTLFENGEFARKEIRSE